jgi:dolichol-phosphate mannosyltransferase
MYEAILASIKKLPYQFELIFIDDGSRDESPAIARKFAEQDERVTFIEFARNFGKEEAVSAGLHAATGDAAVILDADLQHPPKLIKKFIKEWEKGAGVVIGVRKYSDGETWFKRFSSRMFYRIIKMISSTDMVPHATDFRLLDRTAVNAFKQFTERNRITRGLIDWMGFKRGYVHFEAPPRQNGVATYSYKKLFNLAINSFTAHSLVPLKFAGYLGGLILI